MSLEEFADIEVAEAIEREERQKNAAEYMPSLQHTSALFYLHLVLTGVPKVLGCASLISRKQGKKTTWILWRRLHTGRNDYVGSVCFSYRCCATGTGLGTTGRVIT